MSARVPDREVTRFLREYAYELYEQERHANELSFEVGCLADEGEPAPDLRDGLARLRAVIDQHATAWRELRNLQLARRRRAGQ
jgi:hypothetical protein